MAHVESDKEPFRGCSKLRIYRVAARISKATILDQPMMCRERTYELGATVKVRHVVSYPLPDGLPEGAQVKVVAMEPGSRVVEYQCERFGVSMTNVTAGLEYQVGGKWLDERDPRVLKARRFGKQ